MEKFSQETAEEKPSDHDRRVAKNFPWAMSQKEFDKMIEDPHYNPDEED